MQYLDLARSAPVGSPRATSGCAGALSQRKRRDPNQLRLAADGFFSAAVPMKEGRNRIRVLARSSSGGVTQKVLNVDFRRGGQQSMELEVFLEKERQLNKGIEKLGR